MKRKKGGRRRREEGMGRREKNKRESMREGKRDRGREYALTAQCI